MTYDVIFNVHDELTITQLHPKTKSNVIISSYYSNATMTLYVKIQRRACIHPYTYIHIRTMENYVESSELPKGHPINPPNLRAQDLMSSRMGAVCLMRPTRACNAVGPDDV